jgi:hypothetical protein
MQSTRTTGVYHVEATVIGIEKDLYVFDAGTIHYGEPTYYFKVCISPLSSDISGPIYFKVFLNTMLGMRFQQDLLNFTAHPYIFTLEYGAFICLRDYILVRPIINNSGAQK